MIRSKTLSCLVIAGFMSAGLSSHAFVNENIAPQLAVEDGTTIDFTVLRKGKPFGQHVLTFDKDADGTLNVRTEVDLAVKFGPFTVFRYDLESTEVWRDGKLVEVNSKTNNNGKDRSVELTRKGDQFLIDSTKFDGTISANTIPSTHWNIAQVMGSQILSTETGEIIPATIENLGREIVTVDGQTVEATRYRMDAEIDVDLWYDDNQRWVKLAFETQGQEIEYRLNRLY